MSLTIDKISSAVRKTVTTILTLLSSHVLKHTLKPAQFCRLKNVAANS